MRSLLAIMGAGLLGLGSPADAATVYNVSINGAVLGTKSTIMCNSESPLSCLSSYPGGVASEAYSSDFSVALFPMTLSQGDNSFSWGHPRASGSWSGIINNNNGYLTGRNLSFFQEDSGVRFGIVGQSWISASAGTFNVVGGIPEPRTWALMLIGFLAVGTALRQAPRRALVPA